MPDKPVDILIRAPNWLGDCVMAVPALRYLAGALPEARIHLAGRRAFRGLLTAQPGVRGFVEAPGRGIGRLLGSMFGAKEAARRSGLAGGVDVGVLLTNSLSTAAWMWRIGARARIGYDLDCRRLFLTHPVACGGMEAAWHFTRYYLGLARVAETVARNTAKPEPEAFLPSEAILAPSLRIGDGARATAARIIREAGITGPYAALAPASAYGAVKDWPPEHYRRLVAMLNRDFPLPAVLTGGADQVEVCAGIAAGQKAAFNLAGKTALDEFTAVVAGASLFVGGDSGGAHVAAALGIPTLVIFGVTNPSRTRPIGPRVRQLGGDGDCGLALSAAAARAAAGKALASISPEAAAAAAREMLDPPNFGVRP